MSSRLPCLLALALTFGSVSAAPPDPADPRITSPARPVQAPAPASAAAVTDPGVGDWRQANRRVAEAGGWRALLRESQAANAPPKPASAASAPARGHHHH